MIPYMGPKNEAIVTHRPTSKVAQIAGARESGLSEPKQRHKVRALARLEEIAKKGYKSTKVAPHILGYQAREAR